MAICHPFLSHTMSKLSRAVKYVIVIWLLALCLAIPQAIQFGLVYQQLANGTLIEGSATCSVKWTLIDHAFVISTVLLFGVPMTIIFVLYLLIGIKLSNSRLFGLKERNSPREAFGHLDSTKGKHSGQKNVLRMLGKLNKLFNFIYILVNLKCTSLHSFFNHCQPLESQMWP